MKRWSTVLDFIASGRAPTSETVVSFEGFETKGDGGASLWVKTGATGLPSQTPIARGDYRFNDASGDEYKLTSGTVFYYDGVVNWFPSPFGVSGAGLYQFNGVDFNYYEDESEVITSQKLTTQELINLSAGFVAGDAIITTGFASAGDGGAGSWVATATTGLTPSQTPVDYGRASLVDATGRQWDLVRQGNQIALWKLGAKAGEDITNIFNAAISEVGGGNGDIILPYAPEDNPCLISSELTIRSNVTIKGISTVNSWLKVANSSPISMFRVRNRNDVAFLDFSIDGNGENQTAGNGINISGSERVEVDGVFVKNIYNTPMIIDGGSSFVTIGKFSFEGGGQGETRGLSLSAVSHVSIGQVNIKDYFGGGVNVSGSSNINIGQVCAVRDFSTTWTTGKGALRFSNESENCTVGSLVCDGWSRGLFILTGSKDISISSVGISNCEGLGFWVEGDNGTAEPKGAGNVTLSSGFIKNTGLGGGAETASVYLSDTSGNVVTGVTVDGDIVEINVNAVSDKNIITNSRALGSITTVGVNTVAANNITGA